MILSFAPSAESQMAFFIVLGILAVATLKYISKRYTIQGLRKHRWNKARKRR